MNGWMDGWMDALPLRSNNNLLLSNITFNLDTNSKINISVLSPTICNNYPIPLQNRIQWDF